MVDTNPIIAEMGMKTMDVVGLGKQNLCRLNAAFKANCEETNLMMLGLML